jgi:hypothetical protein
MKVIVSVSVFFNLVLLATITCLWKPSPQTQPMVSRRTGIVEVNSEAASDRGQRSDLRRARLFDWHRLEAVDYREYIANLRAIQCPEPTVRAIVAADVASLFERRRQQLDLDGLGTGAWSRAEQTRVTASLLGDGSAPGLLRAEQTRPTAGAKKEGGGDIALPLAFADFAQLRLDAGQEDAMRESRQEFILAVGGLNQDPSDPSYAERWQKAQPEQDAALAGLVGRQAFLELQLLGSSTASDESGAR